MRELYQSKEEMNEEQSKTLLDLMIKEHNFKLIQKHVLKLYKSTKEPRYMMLMVIS